VSWEPIIVTTLRRYVRRGASAGLLARLAGGSRNWRLLNESWNIDGRVAHCPRLPAVDVLPLGDPLQGLSAGERRIALAQLVDDCVRQGKALPSQYRLGTWLGSSRSQVGLDLGRLRAEGRIAWNGEPE
jgi:hypothetical protein